MDEAGVMKGSLLFPNDTMIPTTFTAFKHNQYTSDFQICTVFDVSPGLMLFISICLLGNSTWLFNKLLNLVCLNLGL